MALLYVRNAADDGWILVNSSEGNKIYDADGDTKVQCEESADEDIVRIDAGGSEIWVGIATGEVVRPLQPYFRGTLVDDSWTVGSHNLNFAETADVGSNFNEGDGKFTCPVDGVYFVHCQVLTDPTSTFSGTDYWEIKVYLNGSQDISQRQYENNNSSIRPYLEVTGLIEADASDYFLFQLNNAAGSTITPLIEAKFSFAQVYLIG
jgi:hypothetical protein